jgi:pimeloyl-ACP methyl ester carboxylesterase
VSGARPAGEGPVVPRPPDRERTVGTPIELHVVEWGDADAPVVALVHGGGDFARTFDGFAPLLADAGWRVVSWDHRGHGDSARAALGGWAAEQRDAAAVLASCGPGPHRVVGHSKGGVLAIELAVARPDLVGRLVAIDGFVRRQHRSGPAPDNAAHWLDNRRRNRTWSPGTASELAARRRASNSRLDVGWLTYLVEVGAEPVGDGTWRWKLDPATFPGPPHPWPVEASIEVLAAVPCPLLALQAGVTEEMAGQPPTDVIAAACARAADATAEVLDGLGHFAHIENPPRVAARVLEFLAGDR